MTDLNDKDQPKHPQVGYGRPPERTRFAKGRSGNPSGRPKGSKNIATILHETLRQRIVITENGRRKTVTKLEAAMIQLTEKALAGDLKALQLLTALARSVDERTNQSDSQDSTLDEIDDKVFLGIVKRLQSSGGGD